MEAGSRDDIQDKDHLPGGLTGSAPPKSICEGFDQTFKVGLTKE